MSRPLGTPTWIDLGTTDLTTAKTFYEQLFGWEFEDSGEEFGHYNMIRKDGGFVGGAMDTSGVPGPDGEPIPSAWGVFLACEDADATAATAEQHGAQLAFPAAEVGAAGRFAVLTDPTGAQVSLWQAGDVEGYDFTMKPGTPVWFELLSQDFAASKTFYAEVFGFTNTPLGDTYVTNGAGEEASAGLCDVKGFVPAENGSYWRAYIAVEDCDQACEQVTSLGGAVLDGPTDSPFGRLATICDPTGAELQVIDTTRKAEMPTA